MDINKLKRKELLQLPVKKWDEEKTYRDLLLVPTGKKHDSGYSVIAIVGIADSGNMEIAAYCDDIQWAIPEADETYGTQRFTFFRHRLRTDMGYPNGISRMWGNDIRFRVGPSLSSTEVVIVNKEGK